MEWHVQYRAGQTDHIQWHPTPEAAIEAACALLDEGHDVYGIGTGSLSDSITKAQIVRIYELWLRARPGRMVSSNETPKFVR